MAQTFPGTSMVSINNSEQIEQYEGPGSVCLHRLLGESSCNGLGFSSSLHS